MARAATSPELALFRTDNQRVKLYAAIYSPTTIFSALVNQTFTTFDDLLEITYDTATGDYTDVLPDMTLFVGSTAGAWDKGICRVRSIDGSKIYISQTSDISWANNLHLTVVDDFGLWVKHVLLDEELPFMDGGIEYDDQHVNFDPIPIMGGHRVLKLTGATVSATFDFSDSYVIDGSTIATFATVSPTASGGSDLDTDTPTLEWDAVGWHLVYLTLTATNGKTFFGVRYVYIYDDDNMPAGVTIGNNGQDAEAGGWEFSLTMHDNAGLSAVRDHALVIVFAEDWYGETKQSIGPLAGCENVVFTGWIAKETINMNPDAGLVEFTAYTGQYFMAQMPSYPDGVELVTGTPATWNEMQELTVDRGVWHFLHWRSTATRVMDVSLSGDTKRTKEVSSLAGNLWGQLREMAFDQIFARAGINRYNQLFLQVHPNLIPSGSRSSIPVVMTITKADRFDTLEFERITTPEVALVFGTGVVVNSSGIGTPYFSLAPGHTFSRFGALESIENVIVSSQSQANILFGLYRSWRNNPLPEIPIAFIANNRLIEVFPNQYCAISIATGDNIRGYAYSGNLVPLSVSYIYDVDTGYMHTEASFEAVTVEGIVANGDIPGSGDRSTPPLPPLPPLPDFPVIIPGGFPPSAYAGGPPKVLLHLTNAGLAYTENFDTSSPTWISVNAGLTATQAQRINNIHICPNGVVYASYVPSANGNDSFIARAPSIGSTFTLVVDCSDPATNGGDPNFGLWGVAINPLSSEQLGFVMGSPSGTINFYLGAAGTYATGVALSSPSVSCDNLSYGLGFWLLTKYDGYTKIAPGGGSATPAASNIVPHHIRASTTGITYHQKNGADVFIKGENNMGTATEVNSGNTVVVFDGTGIPTQADCDPTGQYIMTRVFAGAKGISSDFGSTFATLPNLPAGNYWFRWAGNGASRWIAAGGTVVRLTLDGGSSWLNREGGLASIVAIPNVNMIRVVEY
jgi:hypothetical protein